MDSPELFRMIEKVADELDQEDEKRMTEPTKSEWDKVKEYEECFFDECAFTNKLSPDQCRYAIDYFSKFINQAITAERERIKESVEGSVYALMYKEGPMPEFDIWRENVLPGLINPYKEE